MERRIRELAAADEERRHRPPLDGTEIMELLDLPPGPAIGRALRMLRTLEQDDPDIGHDDAVEALRDRYADIYDFAPVGYFTLDARGVILQVNLAGAILLGIKRSQIGRCRFAASVEAACLPEFAAFIDLVLKSQQRQTCEILLTATDRRPVARVRIEAVADDNGQECRMVVIDITGERSSNSSA